MKTAQAILRSTSLPVAVVAARVGFENYSYFSQVYKKVIGITPSAERGKHTDAEYSQGSGPTVPVSNFIQVP